MAFLSSSKTGYKTEEKIKITVKPVGKDAPLKDDLTVEFPGKFSLGYFLTWLRKRQGMKPEESMVRPSQCVLC